MEALGALLLLALLSGVADLARFLVLWHGPSIAARSPNRKGDPPVPEGEGHNPLGSPPGVGVAPSVPDN